MPVLIGTPSLVLASRVEVYHTSSVDLTWQRAIHSCQRCPRAVLVTNNAAIAPITQSNVERTTSRFCPAGVHMSNCVPASEIFTAPNKQTLLKPLLPGAQTSSLPLGSPGLNLSPSAWGPPNLPVPAVTHHHPIHTIQSSRASLNSPTASPTTVVVRESEKPTPQQITTGERAKLVLTKSADADKNTTTTKPSPVVSTTTSTPSATILSAASVTSKSNVSSKKNSSMNEVQTLRHPISEVSIIRENEVPKSPTSVSPPPSRENSQLNGTAEDRVITVPDSGPVKSVEHEANLTNSMPENTNDSRVSDSNASKKRKEEAIQSVARSKIGVVSDSLQTSDVEISPPNRVSGRPIGQEEDADKPRFTRASRFTERSVSGARHSASSPLPGSDAQKLDITSIRQSSAASPRDSRESSRHHSSGTQSSLVSSGGGVGDVSPTPVKTNGTARPDQSGSATADIQAAPSKPLASTAQSRKMVPSFHFPLGTTRMTKEEIAFEIDRAKRELGRMAENLSNGNKTGSPDVLIPYTSFGQVSKALNCPLYWKYIVYTASGGTNDHQPLPQSAVLKMWNQVLTSCPDETARFVHMLTKGRATHLVQTDFNPLIQDILESHPGLAFLQAAKDFHSRYVATVVARIFFNVNTSWSGRITLGELRRSNFLAVLASLEDEEDINLVTQYFSYEHFYVIYCKFWELDEDHDLIISRADLARHNNYAISERMIDRIFSGTVTRGTAFKEGVMTYPDFVWFLLAEEDKRHPRSIEYWFRCMDLDGDGLLSMYELEYFYSEQVARMEEMGIEPISFEDCLCQCLDMVKPVLGDKIRLSDMKQCRLCHIFFDTFFNLPKYLQHEQRDPFANLRDIEEGLNELSDWDRYAAEAYEMLVAVEGGNQEDGVDDDDGDDEELEEEHEVETPVTLGSKADTSPRKDNGSNSKLETANADQKLSGSVATVGAGESSDVIGSSDNGRKGKRRRDGA
ncbi:Serine/threonine-protein phosphatase 2A regulatory subunit B'' subunit alpha [Fasciola hepatica]|uniref:Serine/threonine-protein phosphatase 2A regulatory subunit B'' subunit alpha n=1 Tax=Fasciola hepatica TaxID=6192 RepID=A0A4E0S1A2_FASHE|nr:Serine/threonine-protein phosphatase 2A regulatory subunit B'' subunit alpha [Fasciola hepatica]